MTVRRSLLLGATVAVASALLLGCTARPTTPHPTATQPTASAPAATAQQPVTHPAAPGTSLRDLGAALGLRVGAAVSERALGSSASRALLADQFSTVTPEAQMKWAAVEPTRGRYDWAPADELVAFAAQHGQLVRGHTLIWHRQIPSWLTAGVADGTIGTTELRALLKQHITDEVAHFTGRIWQWDVVNEAFSDPSTAHPDPAPARFWVEHLGAGILADAYRWAHAADPHALLFYNDYGIEDVNAKSTAVLTWIKGLKAEGVPIDGVGFQTHLDTRRAAPKELTANLRRFAALGLKVAITEADVRTPVEPGTNAPRSADAERIQDAMWRQTVDSCAVVRACISYTVWGISDAQSWVPYSHPDEGAALLFDEQLQPKRQYAVVQRALAAASGPSR
ncbi:MAG: endo-1,4-beta-xylanase [Amnibacterium sp.]